MDCIFCKIIEGKIPAEKVFEDKNMIIIKDINPVSKYHYLLIPKIHYSHLEEASKKAQKQLAESIFKIAELKNVLHLENGYRLVINQGEDAGQAVEHLHIHILAGQKMGWNPA
ncbi:MAG: HIT domain-containing protein [Spirochaetales bacterium]